MQNDITQDRPTYTNEKVNFTWQINVLLTTLVLFISNKIQEPIINEKLTHKTES